MNPIVRALILAFQCKDFGHDQSNGNFVTTTARVRLLEDTAKKAARAVGELLDVELCRRSERQAGALVKIICTADPEQDLLDRQAYAAYRASTIGVGVIPLSWAQLTPRQQDDWRAVVTAVTQTN